MIEQWEKYSTSSLNQRWGGAQKYVLDVAQGAQEAGYEAIVASAPNPHFRDALAGAGIVFREMKHSQRTLRFVTDIKLFFALYKLIRAEKPDILHLNSSKIGGLGALAGRLARVPKIVFTAHGWAFNEKRPWWQKTAIICASKCAALFQDAIICVSGYDKKSALAHSIALARKLVVIHNGIDAQALKFLLRKEAREKFGIAENNFVVGTIANLYQNKSLDTLALAAISASHAIPEMRIVIIGEGSERARLENLIAKYHLEKTVILAGALENAQQYLKAFDLFVLPSKKEGLPYALLEAMAAKIPCVVSSAGGMPEIIENGKNGLILPHMTPSALADAMVSVHKNKKQAKAMGTAALETLKKKFSLENMIKKTLALYT